MPILGVPISALALLLGVSGFVGALLGTGATLRWSLGGIGVCALALLANIAIVYAAKQDADHAFEWLGKAKATRKIDMTQAEVAPELAPFRSDPRFAAILPKASDFADPFMEPVKIIREWVAREATTSSVGSLVASVTSIATKRKSARRL